MARGLVALLVLLLAGAARAQTEIRSGSDVVVKLNQTVAISPAGVASGPSAEITLPGFARGLAWFRHKPFWTAPVFTSDYRTLGGANVLLVWQRMGSSRYHMLAPMVGHWLGTPPEGRFGIQPNAGSLFVYAEGDDPYEMLERAYRAAQPQAVREHKHFPEELRYLGWCSWNAFYEKVDPARLLQAARWLRSEHVPTRTILIDDGWMTTEGRKLAGYDARFPGGLAPVVSELKALGFANVGVWHTLQGYWDGVTPALPHQPARDGLLLPGPGLFAEWHRRLSDAGISFVKVDNQAGTRRFTDDPLPLQQGVQAAWGHRIINCMEMSLDNVYAWTDSAVARTSDDYLPGDPHNTCEHLLQNAYNAVWLANFAWPDYDMFESGQPDGELQAAARALSGGPVYCTDRPGEGNPAVLRRLALRDGRLLQPDQPARVPPEMLLRNPALEAVPLQLSARIERPGYRAEVLGCFHVNKSGGVVSAALAGFSRRQQTHVQQVNLSPGEFDLLTRAEPPVLGLLDKYVGPAAVLSCTRSGNTLTVELAEEGRLGVALERPPAAVRAGGEHHYEKGLLVIEAGRHTEIDL